MIPVDKAMILTFISILQFLYFLVKSSLVIEFGYCFVTAVNIIHMWLNEFNKYSLCTPYLLAPVLGTEDSAMSHQVNNKKPCLKGLDILQGRDRQAK